MPVVSGALVLVIQLFLFRLTTIDRLACDNVLHSRLNAKVKLKMVGVQYNYLN
ncbi:MAG: hypothetical protein ACI87H_001924 [Gammaproteobacteria bacterium]|jgi:hypothetical protein